MSPGAFFRVRSSCVARQPRPTCSSKLATSAAHLTNSGQICRIGHNWSTFDQLGSTVLRCGQLCSMYQLGAPRSWHSAWRCRPSAYCRRTHMRHGRRLLASRACRATAPCHAELHGGLYGWPCLYVLRFSRRTAVVCYDASYLVCGGVHLTNFGQISCNFGQVCCRCGRL